MNVNHHCILLWRMSSWVQHTRRYIRWVEGSRFFYCLLLSIGEMVVFILTDGIMPRQSISSCSLASNRGAVNNRLDGVLQTHTWQLLIDYHLQKFSQPKPTVHIHTAALQCKPTVRQSRFRICNEIFQLHGPPGNTKTYHMSADF